MLNKQKKSSRFMAKLSALFLLVFMAFGSATTCTYAASTTTKIMPLGDSITDCDFWRTMLFNKLAANGYDVESVGCQYGNHEGHSGMLVTQLAQTDQLATWLSKTNPDIVMMHFGTNDSWGNAGTEKILAAYTKLVEQMRANNPNMIIVVAQIIPMHPNDTLDYTAIIEDLNAGIVDWAAEYTTDASPIILCDQYTGFDTDTDTYDGVHPNTSGSQKMCERWYATLTPILSGDLPTVEPTAIPTAIPTVEPTVEPTTEPTVEPTTEPTTEPTAIPTVEPTTEPTVAPTVVPTTQPTDPSTLALEKTVSAWNTGYTMTINIKNNSNEAVTDWELRVKKADFEISNIWCAQLTEEGDELVIKPMAWNQAIGAGNMASFGFQGVGTPAEDFAYTLK